MDAETMAAIASLRSEIAQLRAEMAQAAQKAQEGMAGGEGADIGCPMVPIGGGGGDYGPFRWEGDKITHCYFYAEHGIVELQDVQVRPIEKNGWWYLHVPHVNPRMASLVWNEEGSNDVDNTSFKLFRVEGGEVVEDYRGWMFIPIYA